MANKAITDLSAGTTPDGTELLHGVQGGNSRKFTVDQLRGMAPGGVAALAQGDLLYVGASGVVTRLPKGSARQVLRQNAGLTAPEWADSTPLLLSPIALTSGTEKFVTDIPSWVTRINLHFAAVSLSGSANLLVQLGDAGGIETTGYNSASVFAINAGAGTGSNSTAGLVVTLLSAANIVTGTMSISLLDPSANTWVGSGAFALENALGSMAMAGRKSLSAALTQLRISSTTGTDTFDAGSLAVSYE